MSGITSSLGIFSVSLSTIKSSLISISGIDGVGLYEFSPEGLEGFEGFGLSSTGLSSIGLSSIGLSSIGLSSIGLSSIGLSSIG